LDPDFLTGFDLLKRPENNPPFFFFLVAVAKNMVDAPFYRFAFLYALYRSNPMIAVLINVSFLIRRFFLFARGFGFFVAFFMWLWPPFM
jgi:hypothetical protein